MPMTERFHVPRRTDIFSKSLRGKPVDEVVDVGGGGAKTMKEEGDEGDNHQDCHELPS